MPLVSTDITQRLSGGATNSNVNLSLGGVKSSTVIVDNTINNLWDNTAGDEAAAGRTEYRCFYIHNANATLTLLNAVVWISANTTSTGDEVDIALGSSAVNGTEQTIANETTAPTGVTFSHPTTKGAALTIGDIPAGQHKAIWVKRITVAGTAAIDNNGYSISVSGETAAGGTVTNTRNSIMNLPMWSNKSITWAALSDVTVFAYIPNSDGTWSYGGVAYNPATMVTTAHANNVKISLSLGGGLGNEGGIAGAGWFPTIFGSASLRTTSINNVVNEVVAKGYDGVKVDVEGDIFQIRDAGFFTWLSQLRTALKAANPNYFIDWDVFGSWADAIPTEISANHQYVDRILVMLYNGQSYLPQDWVPQWIPLIGTANKKKMVGGFGLHVLTGPELDTNLTWMDNNGYSGYMFWSNDLVTTEDWGIIQTHYTRP